MIHPRHGDDALGRPHRRDGRPGDAPRAARGRRRRAPGTSSRSTATRRTNDTVFVLASGRAGAADAATDAGARAALGAGDRGRRPGPRAPAGRRRRGRHGAHHLPGDRRGRRCRRPRDRPGRVGEPLVKAAVHGRDPNWGRVAGAAGNAVVAEAATLEAAGLRPRRRPRTRPGAPAAVDPAAMRIAIAGHLVYDGPAGRPGADRQGGVPARRWAATRSLIRARPRAWATAPARRSAATSPRPTSARTRSTRT